MQHTRTTLHLAAVAACLLAPPALAAPFCLRNQVIPPQCIYYDAAQCQHDAQKQNAECSANPKELHLSAGYGKYCVVTSEGASDCNYTDPNTCGKEAVRQRGACVEGPTNQPFQAPNPYSRLNGY